METGQPMHYLPFAVYVAGVFVMAGLMLLLSYVLGQRHLERATNAPYESGISITGSARLRFAVRFYTVAMFFVIFDLEAIFLFAWATSARDVGWLGYGEVLVFASILFAALIYIWRTRGLSFSSRFYEPSARNHVT